MPRKTNPTLVGAFVLVSFLLLIAGLVMLGGGQWFVEKRRFVIYFDSSIKGLTVGAPVTFKGVVVGRVNSLQVRYIRETGKTEIPVLIDLDPAKVVTKDKNEDPGATLLTNMIEQGLRAQLNPESLITNQQVVQLDFYPGTPARLVPTKLPYPQIPSLPSTFDQLQASIGMAAASLPDLAASATNTLNQMSGMLTPANQEKVSRILDNIEQVTGELAAHKGELARTLVSLQQASENLNRVLLAVDQTLSDNKKPLGEMIVSLNKTAQSVQQLTDGLAALVGEDRQGLKDFANGSLYDLAALIRDSRVLVRHATDTVDQINRDPSRFIFNDKEAGVPAR